MVISQLILLFVGNILMAYYHSRVIKNHKKVKHWLWGGLYFVVSVALALHFKSWVFLGCSLIQRIPIFNSALNLFRGKPLFYVSTAPEGKSLWYCLDHDISIIDWIHYKVFGKHAELYSIIYLLLWMLGTGYLLANAK